MTTILSANGFIQIPEEFRKADALKPGQRCEIERLGQGEYRVRVAGESASSARSFRRMKYLADVYVLSEATKTHKELRVIQWLQDHQAEIVVDPIVMGELWEDIVALPDGRRKPNLMEWFKTSPTGLICLDWTLRTAMVWAALRDDVRRRGFTVPVKDTLIAATAKLHGLTVATRNVVEFERCGVPIVNPFD